MQGAAGRTVNVEQITSADDTKTTDVEVRVASLQRVKRPLDEVDSARYGIIPLGQLEAAAYSQITELGQDSRHVRMKVRFVLANAGIGQRKTHHSAFDECSDDLSASLGGNHIHL